MKCDKCGAPVRPMPPDGDVLFDEAQISNTRPQPAPPAGEPDFMRDAETFARKENAPFGVERLLRQFGQRMYRLGLAAQPKVEDAEVAEFIAVLRLAPADLSGANIAWFDRCRKAADLLERLAGELAEVTVDRDEWKQQHENLVGVRQTDIANLAAKIDDLKRELDRRKGDPRTRLHNLCEALQEDLDKSPYTREEWEQVDREIVELQHKLRATVAKLAEREAELAKADAVIAEYVRDDVIFDAEKEPTLKTFDNQREAQRRHAARQQQKASAEPTEREEETR